FLDYKMTSVEELCGKGKDLIPLNQVPVECVRDYACEDADVTWRLREQFEPQLDTLQLTMLFRDVEMPLVGVLAEMEWTGITIDAAWSAPTKPGSGAGGRAFEQETSRAAGEEFTINPTPRLREILFEKLNLPVLKRRRPARRRTPACCSSWPTTAIIFRCSS